MGKAGDLIGKRFGKLTAVEKQMPMKITAGYGDVNVIIAIHVL